MFSSSTISEYFSFLLQIKGFVIFLLFNGSVGVEFNYDSSSSIGPQFWGTLWNMDCGLQRQSPVALNHEDSVFTVTPKPLVFWNYEALPIYGTTRALNDGNTVTVMMKYQSPPLIFGGTLPSIYRFQSFHFHWGSESDKGSEHTIDGERFPMEMHLVHQDIQVEDDEEALETPNSLVIFSVMFEISLFDNPFLQPIINTFRNINKAGSEVDFVLPYSISTLLPLDLESYYMYSGSLTTPRCNEVALWIVFTQPIPVSETQMREFRSLLNNEDEPLVNNFRPLQPLNGRIIYRHGRRKPRKHLCQKNPHQCHLINRYAASLLANSLTYL